MIIETAEYNSKLIAIFVKWYWFEMPSRIFSQIQKYISVIVQIFSFKFLFKTLFNPWKNQAYAYPSKGFDLKRIFEVWTSNMVSRTVGAFVRGFTMLFGGIIIIFVIFLGLLCLLIWMFYPVLFISLIILSFI
ncbi:MAG: hypothetical protein RLZZ223_572 [Candidatus Parcubacteria bacterium]|jgi:hypothetical protein